MPFGLTQENAAAVIAHHLAPGETHLALIPIGRKILALTSSNRIILSSFPFFGAPKILREHSVSDVKSVEYTMAGTKIVLTMDTGGGPEQFNVVLSPFFRPSEAVKTLTEAVFAANKEARPDYLEPDETILETAKMKEGVLKLTDKNIYLFTGKGQGELAEKTPISTLAEFDYYPTAWNSVILYFMRQDGRPSIFKLGAGAQMLAKMRDEGHADLLADTVVAAMARHGQRPKPRYISDAERVVTTLRAAHSRMGAIKLSRILRVTNERIIDLTADSTGRLVEQASVFFSDITKAGITRYRGQHGQTQLVALRIRTGRGEKHSFWTDIEYEFAIGKIADLINGYDPEDEEF